MSILRAGRPVALTALCAVMGSAPQAEQAQGEWSLVYARPAVGKYEDISFPDAKHGWVASASGSILMTSDGGLTWSVQAAGLQRLRSLHFLDAKHGFAGSLAGILYETTDGGVTWNDITHRLPKAAKGFCGIS